MRRITIAALLLVGCLHSTLAHESFSYSRIHQLILQHQFTEAERLMRHSGLLTEDIVYLRQLSDFMQINLTADESKLDEYKRLTDGRLEFLKQRTGPAARFTEAVVLLESSITRGRFGEYIPAALEFNKSYGIIKDLNKSHPDYQPGKMMKGIMLVLFGSVPQEYGWVFKMMNVEGDVDTGLKILHNVFRRNLHKENQDFLAESLFFLTMSYRNFKPDPEGLRQVASYYTLPAVDSLITNSPVMRFAAVTLVKQLGKNELALSYMNREYPLQPEIPYYYLEYYLKGKSLLQKLDPAAERYFRKYIDEFPGVMYKKSAAQKIAWIKLISQGENEWWNAMQEVGAIDKAVTGADDAAQKAFESRQAPNRILLKVRLLFDGGYYKKALSELVSHKPSEAYSSKKDGLEFTYRLARIYHELDITTKAKSYYQITIDEGRDQGYYFAANAALLLGKIYMLEGDHQKAAEKFRQCLNMKPDTYRSSIHQKAKAYLEQVK